MRRTPLLAVAAALALLVTLPLGATAGAAATAYDAPVFSDLNLVPDADPGPDWTDKPGHVTGTVTTDAPFVLVQLRDEGGSHVPDPHYIDNPSGEIQFDLEAWGYTSDAPPAYPLQVVAAACSTARSADCSPPVDSATFQVHDVVPAVTFPTDGTLVAGQDYALSVADPQGGGSLRAIWVPDSAEGDVTEQDVDREDPTTLTGLGQGTGELLIRRCRATYAVDPFHCRDLGLTRNLELDSTVSSSGSITSATPVGPSTTQVTLGTQVSDAGTYALDWKLRDASEAIKGSGTANGTVTESKTTSFTLALPSGLTSGQYHVTAGMARSSSAGDAFTSTFTTPAFEVDATPPVVGEPTTSRSTLLPHPDGYQDSVSVSVSSAGDPRTRTVQLQALDQGGQVVRTLPLQSGGPGTFSFTWTGDDDAGSALPPGTYTFRARSTDAVGNVSGWTAGGSVDLDDSRLVSRTWSRAISATDSRIASTVGRCSTLRNPSAHGWAESLGLLSGYRCRSSVASDLLVSTIHAVTLPALPHPEAADRYDTIVVKAYGGAARTRTTSTGTIRYFSAAGASGSVRAMSAPVGYHAGYVRNAPSLVRPDQSFRWGTYTSAGRQYDVKHFVVTLTYSVLE